MKNSSLSSKLLLWALFPIVCFAIAIYGVKWYCDTVTPSEYQRLAKLGPHDITEEFVKKEELPECLSRHNVSFIANVTHIFPELQAKAKEEADDDFYVSNFRKGNVYAFEEYNGQTKSWWLYYYNGGWQLHELKNNAPDFANSVIKVILILTFGICLISYCVTECIPKPKMSENEPSSLMPKFLSGLSWGLCGGLCCYLFDEDFEVVDESLPYYPVLVMIALIISEISVIMSVLYAHYVNRELDLNLNASKETDVPTQTSKWGEQIRGKFIQVEDDNLTNSNRMEIVINDGWLLLFENNCWERYTYVEAEVNSSIFATNDTGKTILITYSDKYDYYLTYNGTDFTHSGKPLSEMKQEKKLQLRDSIIAELTRKNFVQKIFGFISKNDDTQQRVDRINQLFEDAYEIKGITSRWDIESFIKEQLKHDKKQK